jgi:hypothetical protein
MIDLFALRKVRYYEVEQSIDPFIQIKVWLKARWSIVYCAYLSPRFIEERDPRPLNMRGMDGESQKPIMRIGVVTFFNWSRGL